MLTSLQKMTMLGSKFILHAPSSCPVQPWWVILVNTMPVNYKLKQLKSGNPHECSEKVCVHIWNLCPERKFLYLYYYCTLHFKYTFRHSCGKHLIQWQQCIFRASSIHYVWCHSVFILPSFRLLWEHMCFAILLHYTFPFLSAVIPLCIFSGSEWVCFVKQEKALDTTALYSIPEKEGNHFSTLATPMKGL